MKKMWTAVTVVTLFAAVYQVAPYVGVPDNAVFLMFVISPFLVIGMVYAILKYGKPSDRTFSERFYEDYDTND